MGISPYMEHDSKVITVLLTILAVGLLGCYRLPPRLEAPDWEPEAMAKAAIDSADKNTDRILDAEEQEALPGVKAAAKAIDTNENGKIEESELVARIQLYRDMRTAYRRKSVLVKYQGRPLANAKVHLVPEPFVASILEPADGVTDSSGMAALKAASIDIDVMRVGFYQAQITSDQVKLPEKYNTKTTLGLETSPVSDGELVPDLVQFDLK
jgi:hypothetical protein